METLTMTSPSKNDPINNPKHYVHGDLECLDVLEHLYGIDAVRQYAEIRAFVYTFRMNKKHVHTNEDKDKAIWMLRYSKGDDPRKTPAPARWRPSLDDVMEMDAKTEMERVFNHSQKG